jgi:hypothetical protein
MNVEQICTSLPDVTVSYMGERPHYKVRGQIFCGASRPDEPPNVTLRLAADHADARLATDPRFTKAPYGVGAVQMSLAGEVDWHDVRALIEESYRSVVEGLEAPTKAKATSSKRTTSKPKAKVSKPKAKVSKPRSRRS